MVEDQLLTLLAHIETERGMRPPAKLPAPFTIKTGFPAEPEPYGSGLAGMHAAASDITPPTGHRIVAAPPALAIETDPQAARIAMLQARIYDLQSNAGSAQHAYMPESTRFPETSYRALTGI